MVDGRMEKKYMDGEVGLWKHKYVDSQESGVD